jgi:hypothetical protein
LEATRSIHLQIEGASPEETSRGLAAAQAVFEKAGVTAGKAYWAICELESADDLGWSECRGRCRPPKAMPVILTTPEECEAWMMAPWELASTLQRPMPDGSLDILARGVKKDGPGEDPFPAVAPPQQGDLF